MAATVTLEFLARQLARIIADQAERRDNIRVLTAIVLRHENTLEAIPEQIRVMAAQHARFHDRLRRLEGHPAQ